MVYIIYKDNYNEQKSLAIYHFRLYDIRIERCDQVKLSCKLLIHKYVLQYRGSLHLDK